MMRSRHRPRFVLVAAVVAFGVGVAACGGDDDDVSADGTTATTAATTTTSGESTTTTTGDASGTQPAGEATVAVAASDLGDVLVDASGMTLYLFTADTDGTSTCNDDCAGSWPPLTVDGGVQVGEGLDEGLFTTITRDDGSTQVAVNGHPLYGYAGDTGPGDTAGQGVGGAWYVVSPEGEAIEDSTTEGASTTESSAPNPGYGY
jgi:predicted lipoprotein with Yx(FWY)xxD motif